METDEQRAANERAQVAEVFGLTGGELEDVAWVPNYRTGEGSALFNTAVWTPFRFTYWYVGVPGYAAEDFDPTAEQYRTVCRDEMFGQVPQTVTDDEGTWKVVTRYRSSGERECPGKNGAIPGIADERGLNIMDGPCLLCGENPQSFHGYIYIGDGWAEIVYQLEKRVCNICSDGYEDVGHTEEAHTLVCLYEHHLHTEVEMVGIMLAEAEAVGANVATLREEYEAVPDDDDSIAEFFRDWAQDIESAIWDAGYCAGTNSDAGVWTIHTAVADTE